VVAVSDEASNSVIVSAPDQFMSTITDIVTSLDTNISGVTETRIFALQHADATEMAGVLTTLYTDPTGQQQAQQRSGSNNNRGPFPMFVVGQPQNAGQQQSQRTLMEARVVVVADPRTNSVIVSCSHDTMEDVALTIGRLDSTDARKQHVRIYTLENADPDNVAAILRGMFSPNAADTSNQQAADVLTQRTATGASTDIVNTLNTNGNSGGGGGGGNGGGGIR
jgi:type II secretory pathway component GspD/PulD (secretin)